MAKAVIVKGSNNKIGNAYSIGYPVVEVEDLKRNVIVLDKLKHRTEQISPTNYPLIQVEGFTRDTVITEILPFRVKFTAIQVVAIGLGNTPAIPLQVIGYSNYIL
jgi:hypothetical protein